MLESWERFLRKNATSSEDREVRQLSGAVIHVISLRPGKILGWKNAKAGTLKHKRMTSWPSLKTYIINAGAQWVDREVVVDHKPITSRRPSYIPAFINAMIREITAERISLRPDKEGHNLTF